MPRKVRVQEIFAVDTAGTFSSMFAFGAMALVCWCMTATVTSYLL